VIERKHRRFKIYFFALLFVFAIAPAFAEGLPAEVLNQEYEGCMKEASGAPEAQKNAYCTCIRNKMADWAIDTYARIAREVAASGAKSATLEAMTKECFDAAMR
jgi:hypothetical protein